MDLHRPEHPLVTYGTYPLLAAFTAALLAWAVPRGVDNGAVVAVQAVVTITVLALVEWRFPLRARWRMTRETLVGRDLPFLGLAFVVERATELGAGLAAAALVPADGFGPLARLPLVAQALVALLAYDLAWYGYHRAAHASPRLWRAHGVHHAPAQVYVLMHPVFHPFDLVVSRFLISLVVFRLTGAAPGAIVAALAVLNLQQTASHVNADLRLGPLNRWLIGPETHRYHHGADVRGNYGAALAVWDRVFGTFVYEPDRVPARLGLHDPAAFPDPRRFHATLAWFLRPRSALLPPPPAPPDLAVAADA